MFGDTSSNFGLFLFLLFLSIQSTLTIRCYECKSCTNIQSCKCTDIYETNRTNVYCILLRETVPGGVNVEIEHVARNLSRYHVYDTHYISVEEKISYDDQTERWTSVSNEITYGCQTDLCNYDDLLRKLPSNGLSLMLPIDWLNENLQRKAPGNPALCRICDEGRICGNSSDTINTTICPRKDCQGSCMTDEVYENAETTQFCYDSLCTDDTIGVPPPRLPEVIITAFYYFQSNKFEVTEIDVICNADLCDGFTMFQDIKDKLQKNLDNIKPFFPNSVHSIYSTSMLFLTIILFFQMIISY